MKRPRIKDGKYITQGQTTNKLVYELSSNYKIQCCQHYGCERSENAECGWGEDRTGRK